MAEILIINEMPISIGEVRVALDKIEKRDKTVSEMAKKTIEYAERVAKKTSEDIDKIKNALEKIEIARLKPRHIAKIIDIYPKDIESLKSIFAAESVTLKQEDLHRILECLK